MLGSKLTGYRCVLAGACVMASAFGIVNPAPAVAARTATAPDVVRVSTGLLRGMSVAGYREFLGIPYAAPPVGRLRWQAPQPAAAWSGIREATRPGPECPQAAGLAGLLGGSGSLAPGSSENCLYLNVWVPDRLPPSGVPVLVWIHGGSFTSGAGADYDAATFMTSAAGPMIVVTINYRLGALGFLASQGFQAPSGETGNYGLLDQQAALRWVHQNIAAFGGDPRRVTVAGESAGAIAVCAQLAAPGSAGLFQAAILESGGCEAGATRAQAEQTAATYAAALGCTSPATAAACLRAVPVPELVAAAAPPGGWNSVSGTPFLPVSPVAALAAGHTDRVPVLNGTNHDEMTLFVYAEYGLPGLDHPLTAAEYPAAVAADIGLTRQQAAAVVARYPVSGYADPAVALSTAWTDHDVCPILLENAAFAQRAPTYQYQFDDPSPPAPPSYFPLGAYHASELPYLWQMSTLFGILPLHMTPAQRKLSAQMVRYWSEFVISGDPDPPGLPAAPRYDATAPWYLSLRPGGNLQLRNFAAQHQCGFWNSVRPVSSSTRGTAPRGRGDQSGNVMRFL
jgi:para-nitrobenzyl esterase